METDSPTPPPHHRVMPSGASTPGQDEARRTITRTTITPAPGTVLAHEPDVAKMPLRERMRRSGQHGELGTAQAPVRGPSILRVAMTTMLAFCSLLTVAGACLVLLLWRQNKDNGVLTEHLDTVWETFGYLRDIERWVALGVVPVAVCWIAIATLNVGRATGQRPSSIVAALSLPVGLAGVWFVGSELLTDDKEPLVRGAGFALQLVFLALPLVAIERVAEAAEARHRPLRAAFVIGAGYLAQLEFFSALSTTEETRDPQEWGRLGAYLVIAGLLQVLGTLSVNEAARAIEDGSQHRFELRQRFGESVMAQAVR
jgi:hypothetical protein